MPLRWLALETTAGMLKDVMIFNSDGMMSRRLMLQKLDIQILSSLFEISDPPTRRKLLPPQKYLQQGCVEEKVDETSVRASCIN